MFVDPYEGRGVPVAEPSTGLTEPSPAIPEPENGGLENIKYDLQERVIKGAGIAGPTKVECDVKQIPRTRGDFGCTVDYDGLKVPFTVTITDVTDGSALGLFLFEWEVKGDQGVITRQGVFDGFWRDNVRAGYRNMRCDGSIPEKVLVPVGKTGYFCYATSKRNDSRRFAVQIGEHGLSFPVDDGD